MQKRERMGTVEWLVDAAGRKIVTRECYTNPICDVPRIVLPGCFGYVVENKIRVQKGWTHVPVGNVESVPS